MYNGKLKFNSNGKFRIVIFTDIHSKPINKASKCSLKKEDTLNFINKALDELKPDFVILGGDNCTDFEEFKELDEMFNYITEPFIKRKIPYAPVLGNHEHDSDSEKLKYIINLYEKKDYSLAKNEAKNIENTLNYHIVIKSSDGLKDAFTIWLMDSNNTIDLGDRIVYDCVHRNQIDWYQKTAEKIKENNGGKIIPAILFQHIPVPEIYNLLRSPKVYELPVAVEGHDILKVHKYVKNKTCKGYLGEGPDCSFYNDGEFASWKKVGDIVGAYFGHDHMNDFDGTFDGVHMGQCKTGGFWAYTDGCRTGARVIDIDENSPKNINSYMVHFKDYGLKSKSLGPIMKRITDRQSLTLHKLKWIVLFIIVLLLIIFYHFK